MSLQKTKLVFLGNRSTPFQSQLIPFRNHICDSKPSLWGTAHKYEIASMCESDVEYFRRAHNRPNPFTRLPPPVSAYCLSKCSLSDWRAPRSRRSESRGPRAGGPQEQAARLPQLLTQAFSQCAPWERGSWARDTERKPLKMILTLEQSHY